MRANNFFNLNRFVNLLKLEWYNGRKAVFITFVVAIGLLLCSFIAQSVIAETKIYNSHTSDYISTLLIGGFILSSLSFNELGNKIKRHSYLVLPVSTFEKLLCMWLYTCIAWIVTFTIAYFAYTHISNLFGRLLFKNMTYPDFTFNALCFNAIHYYIVLQGIFLVGAAHFKGYALPKTLFTLLIFGLIGGCIAYFCLVSIPKTLTECSIDTCNPIQENAMQHWWAIIKGLFWWALAPLCWIITYYGLKDNEV